MFLFSRCLNYLCFFRSLCSFLFFLFLQLIILSTICVFALSLLLLLHHYQHRYQLRSHLAAHLSEITNNSIVLVSRHFLRRAVLIFLVGRSFLSCSFVYVITWGLLCGFVLRCVDFKRICYLYYSFYYCRLFFKPLSILFILLTLYIYFIP